MYTIDLKYIHKKKSKRIKIQDLEAQEISPKRKIIILRKRFSEVEFMPLLYGLSNCIGNGNCNMNQNCIMKLQTLLLRLQFNGMGYPESFCVNRF